ncbi:BTB/POZ and MATH domain-containing protein 2 [Setaria viridis]|nr:BTB/POZ and MATH domain-containing protein 2-like [Setaria viridis]
MEHDAMPPSPPCSAAADDGYSASIAETATGWHLLKVVGYSQFKGIGVARRIKSSSFLVGGHSWCVIFFPDGSSEETAEWVSLGLRLERLGSTDGGDVLVRTKYSFLDRVGEPIPSSTRTGTSWLTFSRTSQSWVYSQFIKREDMESSYVKKDKFCIRCDVRVIENCCQLSAAVPPSEMRRHFMDLLASGVGADVAFDVGGETFAAHKNVLAARSSVFKAEFFGGTMKENVATRVRVDGIEPRVFKAMLHFVYTDSLPRFDRGDELVMAQHLLVAADRYDMQRLASMCEFALCLFIDTSVVVSTLVLAEQHGCRRLKEACFKFLKDSGKYKEVLMGDDFEHLANSCPSLVDELCEKFGVSPLGN